MGLDYVLDREAVFRRLLEINLYVALRIHNGRHALRPQHVGGV
jgi:hypothetical protein